jgi:catechol 2,3-dioxygenase-like lactoylglutathione lyase family enzyme
MRKSIATAILLLTTMSGAEAQQPAPDMAGVAVAAPVPFGPGEKLSYRITYGILGKRGNASTEVVGVEDVRGNPSYHLSFRMKGGALGFGLDDHQESWLDVDELYSHRFKQDLNQTTYERLRTLDFYPDERVWRRVESVDSGALATDMPLDDVSFLYWARTLPLEVGETYEFRRYYKEAGNPVILKVLRRETVTVPAGTFNTIVVQPLIRTSGLFGDGGRAEVYFTDDDRRLIVLLHTRMSIGTLKLQLERYTPGAELAAGER